MGYALTPDSTQPRLGARRRSPTRLAVDVESAHLANPLVAASRLLASEAGELVHIDGDENHIEVTIAVSDHPGSA